MINNIVNFPHNQMGVARLDSNGVVHNHIYHECPVGKVDENKIIYDNNSPIGRVDEYGIIHNHPTNNSPIGRVDNNGYIHNHPTENSLVARVDGDSQFAAGGAYLLLLSDIR